MAIGIRNGFFVSVSYPGQQVTRVARIVEVQPEGRVRRDGAIHFKGRRYVKAFHFTDGIEQGRAVAWPEERV